MGSSLSSVNSSGIVDELPSHPQRVSRFFSRRFKPQEKNRIERFRFKTSKIEASTTRRRKGDDRRYRSRLKESHWVSGEARSDDSISTDSRLLHCSCYCKFFSESRSKFNVLTTADKFVGPPERCQLSGSQRRCGQSRSQQNAMRRG